MLEGVLQAKKKLINDTKTYKSIKHTGKDKYTVRFRKLILLYMVC